jgi:hypothetical protein
MIFAREAFLNAQEAGRGTVTVGPTVFGTADIAVVLVDCGEVRAAALGASEKGFRTLAVGDGVTQAEAATALDEGGARFEGADSGLAAEKVRG